MELIIRYIAVIFGMVVLTIATLTILSIILAIMFVIVGTFISII